MTQKINQALAQHQAGNVQEAEKAYREILQEAPSNINTLQLLGALLCQKKQYAEGVEYLQKVLTINPNLADVHHNLAISFKQQQKYQEAIFHYQQAIKLTPKAVNIHNQLAKLLWKLGEKSTAISHYQQVALLQPEDAVSQLNFANALEQLEIIDEAIIYYQKAIALQSNLTLAYNALGNLYTKKNLLEEAINYYYQALSIDVNYAEIHFNLAIALLLKGDLPRGFAEYEWRWQAKGGPPPIQTTKPLWDGSDLTGKTILLCGEQGFGDAIQFVRYVPLVIKKGGKVIIGCTEALVRLFSAIPGIEKVSNQVEESEFQVQAPLMSLPRILGTTLETIPASVPYLYLPQTEKQLEQIITSHAASDKLKVGIVWAGSPNNRDDRNRSCSLSDFLPLLEIPNIAIYSLQKGERAHELSQLKNNQSILDLSKHLVDFADTAYVISQLDLIISVDTAVVHLAGALGKPVWVILAYSPDWRWMLDRDDSPWYPTVKLFRQSQRGDWQGLFMQVKQELMV